MSSSSWTAPRTAVLGGARVRRAPVGREELSRVLTDLRRARPGLRVVLANGCFEMLHVGHLRYLDDARSRGDVLVVALNSDAGVRLLKGAGRPLVGFDERAELLLGLRCVDWVVGFEERTVEETLRALRPSVHAKGTDYTSDTIPERGVDEALGIEIAICGDPKQHSSTSIAARVAARTERGVGREA
jgi:rfaE bifunctional protein nucleotidyltransferase chain/domain